MGDTEELWAAFRAGFIASHEGWNGEYPRDSSDGRQLRDEFESWRRDPDAWLKQQEEKKS